MSGVRSLAAVVTAIAVLGAARAATAQPAEVAVQQSASADLYIRNRPPVPQTPKLSPVLKRLLAKREKQLAAKRKQAIALLRQFLAAHPTGAARAEGQFKLAELLWEDARRKFLHKSDIYDRELEACREKRASCKGKPRPPALDFSKSEKLYLAILHDYPQFRRADLVLYLAGFAAKEEGHADQALKRFRGVIARYPNSSVYSDAWMMIGELRFAAGKWDAARSAYGRILSHPDSPTYDLALFKTAWCDWKLGQTRRAAKRFKRVLDLAAEAKRTGNIRLIRRRAQLRDEALNYLVLVFSEDNSESAKDVYDFLASIGGKRYSREVLTRLAGMFYDQASYTRSVQAYRYLIGLAPNGIRAAGYQRRIVQADMAALDYKSALAQINTLVSTYGPGSAWARANKDLPHSLADSITATETLVRTVGKNLHAQAQQFEKQRHAPDLHMYRRAATVYRAYLQRFSNSRHAPEVRFLLAEILYFKLHQYEQAGDEYLAVGKSKPVGKYNKDALLKAMAAYQKARPKNIDTTGRRKLLPVDRKFAEATDVYATLFPADPGIVNVIFKNGQLFYEYGNYDEAIKRFGLIVTKYPNDPNAGAAGDRILSALNKAHDYQNIATWARRLKKARAFQSRKQQRRLNRLIVESIFKSGQKAGAAHHYARAAAFYLRIPKEFPHQPAAPQALRNAAVMLEQSKKPEKAATTYLSLIDRYPRSKLAADAGFAAAQVYEQMAYFERAAKAYELVARRYPRSDHGADALFNAGVLRQALGQNRRAIVHYERYARRYAGRKDAEEVAFRVGAVYEQAGNTRRAERAFSAYTRRYPNGAHVIEAYVRAGRTALKLRRTKLAARDLATALARYKRLRGKTKQEDLPWAAEARYRQGELIFRKFARIHLDVRPRRLQKTLDRKTKLLDSAQNVYLDVVDYGDPKWATAALYRIGSVFDEFAKSLRTAPPPAGLSKAEKKKYRQELDVYVIDVEEKAIKLYTVGYKKALKLGVYNKFTKKLHDALGRLAASKFPPEHEARQKRRVGDRPPHFHLVEKVRRDR